MSVRPETGPMQFGDDWPGIFIRGDSALGAANCLDAAIKEMPETVYKGIAQSLAKLLREAQMTYEKVEGRSVPKPPENLQRLKKWTSTEADRCVVCKLTPDETGEILQGGVLHLSCASHVAHGGAIK